MEIKRVSCTHHISHSGTTLPSLTQFLVSKSLSTNTIVIALLIFSLRLLLLFFFLFFFRLIVHTRTLYQHYLHLRLTRIPQGTSISIDRLHGLELRLHRCRVYTLTTTLSNNGLTLSHSKEHTLLPPCE